MVRPHQFSLPKSILFLAMAITTFVSHGQIKVAAASSTKIAMVKLASIFESQNQGVTIELVMGSTGKLTGQIEHGAPYHLLVAADTSFPKYLHDRKLTATPPKKYATGSLILWSVKGNNQLSSDWSTSILGCNKIGIANAIKAPYGKLAKNTLIEEGLYEKLETRIITASSVSQLNQYILTGAVDIGLTSKSSIQYENVKGRGVWIDIPGSYIDQHVVITKYALSNNYKVAEAFMEFMLSTSGQNVFREAGYLIE